MTSFFKFAGFACATLLVSGCGHPATENECREILRVAARLELKSHLDDSKQLIDQETAAIEAQMKRPMMEKCVGKRITEGALACMRTAKTADALFEECFQ